MQNNQPIKPDRQPLTYTFTVKDWYARQRKEKIREEQERLRFDQGLPMPKDSRFCPQESEDESKYTPNMITSSLDKIKATRLADLLKKVKRSAERFGR
jgi:hypothetical protein